ncbi:WapI family immunity protein [Cryobacterium aureum]|uniref:WapI family immunity protein n=1 Tax=Cryobacterium aureum TaxID=995037 RepID=UPI003F6AFAFC
MQLGVGTRESVTLEPARYEFPNPAGDKWDDNWLIISGDVSARDTEWQFTVPCLTTFEANQISAWLRSVADGSRKRRGRRRGCAVARIHRTKCCVQRCQL